RRRSAPTTNGSTAATLNRKSKIENAPALLAGTLAVLIPCMGNIAVALGAVMSQPKTMPFEQFIDLYVRLRHPHHYDPSSWPAVIWITFFWPMPLAAWAFWRQLPTSAHAPAAPHRHAWEQTALIMLLLCGVLGVALIGAGAWYFNDTLVKLSLYRFSIYPKLISCIATAYLLYDAGIWRRGIVRGLLIGLPVVCAAVML